MHVFEVNQCEEYFMQVSHGLFSTKEVAIEAAKIELRKEYNYAGEEISVVEMDEDSTYVLKGVWTKESFEVWEKAIDSYYWWYHAPFNHHGVFGVFKVSVREKLEDWFKS
jgi:hypothetical protein